MMITFPSSGPCDFDVDQFNIGDDPTADPTAGLCGKPGMVEVYRRRHDGWITIGYRCAEHSGITNELWEMLGNDD